MTFNRKWGPRTASFALVIALLAALGGVSALAVHELAVARGQAQTLVSWGYDAQKRGEPAQASVDFARAELLAPRADFVRAALAALSTPTAESKAAELVTRLAPGEWSFLMVSLGWLAGLSLAFAIQRGKRGRWARRLTWLAGLAFLVSTAGVVESSLNGRALSVVRDATGVLVAPYPGAGASADLPPGALVTVGERYRDFVRVRGPSGATGWVNAHLLQPVVPNLGS